MGKFAEALFDPATANIGDVYPQYIQNLHGRFSVGAGSIDPTDMSVTAGEENVYPNNMVAWSDMAFASNPYMRVEAYDPDSDIEAMSTALSDIATLVDSMDADTDFDAFILNANTAFAAYGVDIADDGDAEITAHAARMKPELNRARSHFLASMFEMNTVNTSFHVMGLASLENEHLWRLEDFRAKIKLSARDSKNRFLIQAVELMYGAQARQMELSRNVTLAFQDYYRTKIQVKGTQIQQNLQWDVADINWEPMVISEAAGIIGIMSGVPHFTKQPSDIQQGIANALSIGPQIGMSVGQATGNVGLGVMAALGGGALAFLGGGSSA